MMVEYYDGYDVVSSGSGVGLDGLKKKVNLMIADGWRPFGNLAVVSLDLGREDGSHQILFYQPMVLRTAGEGE